MLFSVFQVCDTCNVESPNAMFSVVACFDKPKKSVLRTKKTIGLCLVLVCDSVSIGMTLKSGWWTNTNEAIGSQVNIYRYFMLASYLFHPAQKDPGFDTSIGVKEAWGWAHSYNQKLVYQLAISGATMTVAGTLLTKGLSRWIVNIKFKKRDFECGGC